MLPRTKGATAMIAANKQHNNTAGDGDIVTVLVVVII